MFPISPGRPNIISAAYAFILIILAACATATNAQKMMVTVKPSLAPQTQGETNSSTTQKPQKKKGLAPLRNEEEPDGSRVTITYNEPLSDYSAYREGDRFVVVIPKADAPRVRQNMRGRGFDGVQVEKRGDDTVLSFRIQPGVGARVAQQFNKLEVVFSTPQQAASNPGQTASSSSSASASNTTQGRPATVASSQTPLNNHNSTTDNANQTASAKAGAGSTGEAGANASQEGAAGDSSPKPSNNNSTAQPLTGQPTTAQTPPAASVSHEAASSETVLTRYWLPLLIAALLLASAYAVIAARRRTKRGEDMKATMPAATTIEVEAEKPASLPESVDKQLSPDKKPERVHSIEPEEMEAEVAADAATPDISRPGEVDDVRPEEVAQPEAAAFDLEAATLTGTPAGAVSLEANDNRGNGELRSTGIEEERPTPEAIGIAAAQSSPVEAFVGAAAGAAAHVPARVVKEPAMPERNASLIPGKTLRYLKSEDANERAAGVLDLADIGNDEAYGHIGAAFDDPVEQVRGAAARALFNINEDRAASFKRIMRASSPERRRRIGAAIASSGMAGEAISDLSSQSGERAFDALLVLSLMAKAGEVQSLVENIEDHPSTEVRLALVKLLALSGQPDILKTFRYLATRDSLPIAVRSSIMEAIYQLSNS